ncbi:MAG: septum formation initiator family protein [Patescibacteria group bacterium]
MVTKNRRNKKGALQDIFFAIFLGVLAMGFIAFFIISDLRITQRRKEMLSQIDILQKEIQATQEKNDKLKAGITQIGKDVYWEEKIREQGFKKPGEEQVVVLPPQGSTVEPSQQQKNLWQKLLNKIGF